MAQKIGFVSTRFAGTDGVSLEAAKWAHVLTEEGFECFWYSGRNDRPPEVSMCVPEAHFGDPENQWLSERIWGRLHRDRAVSERIQEVAAYLKSTLYRFVEEYDIDILIPQNALTIPMHVPLGIAITEFLAETQMPAIAHHHDFFWERTRFSISAVRDYLDFAFPPSLPHIRHAVINSRAQTRLAFRKGLGSMLVPNVFEFEKPAPGIDDYSADFREQIGLSKDDILVLQPTRVVPRKGIEHTIKLVGLLRDPRYKIVISHDAGDEGYAYKTLLEEMAREEKVELLCISDRVAERRQVDASGKKLYTLWDIYPHADLVTFPSIYEGFGNALLEAFYFKKPVLINRYTVYVEDIEPKGFRLISIDGFIAKETVTDVQVLMEDPAAREAMVEHNYAVATRHYGYTGLRTTLRALIQSLTGTTV
ncbi:MAG: glycosyltransferase involved in cell wall biosynthesis [Verrucomicrobiales bacterium]|jgi:glycosyltransferase involved in cell wall biosynthesis